MTKERLLKAIAKFDVDGKGVERVIEAAKENRSACGSPGRCLLANAWQREGFHTWVEFEDVYFHYLGEDGQLLNIASQHVHGCSDVVSWYDGFLASSAANRAVLEVLND